MHTTYYDVYYEVKVQGNRNLARTCPTHWPWETKYRNIYLEVLSITNKRSTRILKQHYTKLNLHTRYSSQVQPIIN